LLASIGLATLAFNLVLAPAINGEEATARDWIIVAVIISEIAIAIGFGPHSFQLLSLSDIHQLLRTHAFHVFVGAALTWTFALFYLTMNFDPGSGAFTHIRYLTRARRYELYRFCLCVL
jgi:hypothetical protein